MPVDTIEKVYKYYGLEYRFSVTEMAAQVNVSIRTIKTFLKLRAMGYEDKINQGWSAAKWISHRSLSWLALRPSAAAAPNHRSPR